MLVDKTFWSDNRERLASLTLDDARFIYEQAEKRLNDSNETAKKIYERCYNLLTIVSGILIALVTYSINKWQTAKVLDSILITAIAGAFYFLSLGLIFVLKNILPANYMLPGTSPEKYFVKTFFNEKLPDDKRLLEFYKVEIINYAERIRFNCVQNEERWRIYILSLKLLFFSPVIFAALFIMLTLLNL